MWEKSGGFTSHAGVLLSPMSGYCNTDVWTFLKLMVIIEHMKMMQIPYLHIWSMLLSAQVPHRTNLCQLFWNVLFQKKKPNRVCVWGGEGRVWDILFLKKTLWNCFGFSLYLLEISGKTKLHPWKFGKIMYVTSLWNFKSKNQDLWKFHLIFSWSPLDVPRCF